MSLRQLAIFAVIFFALQVGFELLVTGRTLDALLIQRLALATLIATAVYAGIIWALARFRRDRED